MKVGTKSILFGAHAFWLHPFFVAWGWWKLYGFPWDPRLWVAFFVHDLGYWGLSAMDDARGELHPWFGARLMTAIFDRRWWDPACKALDVRTAREAPPAILSPCSGRRVELNSSELAFYNSCGTKVTGFSGDARFVEGGSEAILRFEEGRLGPWGLFCLLHSRFLAKRCGLPVSRLCVADKLAMCLAPWWLYVPMALLSGEIYEYRRCGQGGKTDNSDSSKPGDPHRIWFRGVQAKMRQWVRLHKDGRQDTWTPPQRGRSI